MKRIFSSSARGLWAFLLFALMVVLSFPSRAEKLSRRVLFNDDWCFYQGDVAQAAFPGFDDAAWRRLSLPHDWSVEREFDALAPMGNDGGYLPAGIGWYRKTFTLPRETDGLRYALYFEGVYMNSEVFVNGHSVGKRPYGYSSFLYDVTAHLKPESENVVAVRVDNSQQKNCRWYTGSGIYRHVWLLSYPDVHLKHWGTFITTPEVEASAARVQLDVEVQNESIASRTVTVNATVEHEDNEKGSACAEVEIPAQGTAKATLYIKVENPALWSTDSPALYTAHIRVTEDGDELDADTEVFGIRTFSYDAETGFRLNGSPMELNGGCVHHDNGVLGAKSFNAAEAWKVRLLKQAGFNAVRTSHNIPSEAFLDECDRQGLLVIDESFDGWRAAKTTYDYSKEFDRWWKRDVQDMVLRDRNHPSIFCWSIGNEIIERKSPEAVTTARALAEAVRAVDATRPITSALTTWDSDWAIFDPLAAEHDIVGYNYQLHRAEDDHKRVPSRVLMQTESYPRDAAANWRLVEAHPYIIGDFVWTALDYLGESGIGRYFYKGAVEGEHYERNLYPWHGAYCGDIDLTGWRKPISHYREMLYRPTKQLYMAVREPDGYWGEIKETEWSVWPTWESWNWPGYEGKEIDVEVCSRHPRVRLYLNEQLVGEQSTGHEEAYRTVFRLPYAAGELRAEGLNASGECVEKVMLATAGEPVAIRLTPDRHRLIADGQDLVYVVAEVVDAEGRVVPNAEDELHLTVQGAATLEAAGNADMKDGTPYISSVRRVWKGRAIAVVRSTAKSGKAVLKVTAPGLKEAQVVLRAKKPVSRK